MADKDEWNWKEWTRALILVWGAAGILGGTNGYLSQPSQPKQPVHIVQPAVLTPAYEDARQKFFYLTDSLSTVKQRLNKVSPDPVLIAEIRSISKRLDELPHNLPWDAAMKHRLDTVTNDWSMLDIQPKKKDDSKHEDIDQMENAVSTLIEILQSLCKG